MCEVAGIESLLLSCCTLFSGEGVEKTGSTKPSEEQNDGKNDAADQKSQDLSSQEDTEAEDIPKRQPSIKFPQRMAEGQRISEMPESERPG